MSYSPRSKRDCIDCLEVSYGRKLTTKEKMKTYKELYAWFKRRQTRSLRTKDKMIEKLENDIADCNIVCKMLGINRELKYCANLKEELAELNTI